MATKIDPVEKQARDEAKTNKSEGMRTLLRAGRQVAEVAQFFDAQYGFVYGVATRLAAAGEINLADVTSPREAAAAAPAKATAKAPRTAKSTATKAAPAKATTAKAPARAAKSKTTAKRTAATA